MNEIAGKLMQTDEYNKAAGAAVFKQDAYKPFSGVTFIKDGYKYTLHIANPTLHHAASETHTTYYRMTINKNPLDRETALPQFSLCLYSKYVKQDESIKFVEGDIYFRGIAGKPWRGRDALDLGDKLILKGLFEPQVSKNNLS